MLLQKHQFLHIVFHLVPGALFDELLGLEHVLPDHVNLPLQAPIGRVFLFVLRLNDCHQPLHFESLALPGSLRDQVTIEMLSALSLQQLLLDFLLDFKLAYLREEVDHLLPMLDNLELLIKLHLRYQAPELDLFF